MVTAGCSACRFKLEDPVHLFDQGMQVDFTGRRKLAIGLSPIFIVTSRFFTAARC
jgi:hypothetical protein